jgi:predicted nucleic-acid-binding Zn-ribbon protein
VSGKAPTCTENGLTDGAICSVCGDTLVPQNEIPATGHTCESVVTPPTCTEEGFTTHTCKCGYVYKDTFVEATGHTFGEWEETKAPTCTEEGIKTRKCACGETEEEAIAATGHKYNSVITAPTTDAEGFTTHTCEHCGDSYVDSITEKLPKPDPDNSKTGDSAMVHLWVLGMLCSVTALGALVIYRKKSFRA